MKNLFKISILLITVACTDSETDVLENEYTTNKLTYQLYQGSDFPITGDVVFKERIDQSVEIIVNINGTEGDIYHPVHLHNADINTPDAEIAILLNPVYGKTGESITKVTNFADESKLTFYKISKYYGSVKVHLSSYGDEKDIVLAGGNIGMAAANPKLGVNGRVDIAVCKSK